MKVKAKKTSLKKWICAASNFIALIPSRLICQIWSLILKDCIKVQENKRKVVVLCSSPRKNVKWGTLTFHFANLNLLVFRRFRCRRCRCCLSSLIYQLSKRKVTRLQCVFLILLMYSTIINIYVFKSITLSLHWKRTNAICNCYWKFVLRITKWNFWRP